MRVASRTTSPVALETYTTVSSASPRATVCKGRCMSSALEWVNASSLTMPRCWGRASAAEALSRDEAKVWADASAWAADTLRISSPVVASMTTGAVLSAVQPCCRAQVQWRGGHIHGATTTGQRQPQLLQRALQARRLQGLGRLQRNGHPRSGGRCSSRSAGVSLG